MAVDPAEHAVARDVERAPVGDDRADVLEWVAQAVRESRRTFSTSMNGSTQSFEFIDLYSFTSALARKVEELRRR